MDCGHFGFPSEDSAHANGESQENPQAASTGTHTHFPTRKGRSIISKTFLYKSKGTVFSAQNNKNPAMVQPWERRLF
jgi:hypothetical protein